MSRASIAVTLLAMGLMSGACAGRESLPPPRIPLVGTPTGDAPRIPPTAEIPPLEMPEVHRATLASGLHVEVVERRDLPIVAIVVVARGFSAIDPLVPPGVPALTARVIGRELDRMAIASPSRELTPPLVALTDDGLSITTQVPSTELGPALAQLSASMRATQCHDADVVLARIVMSEDERTFHSVGGFAMQSLKTLLYGANDRRSLPSYGSATILRQLHPGHCAAQRAHGLSPAESSIAIVGDVDHAEALRWVEATMSGWARPDAVAPAPIPRPTFPVPALNVVWVPAWSAAGSVHVVLRSPGPDEPGFAVTGVLTQLLGGMFNARLNLDLRERRGWAYGVHASRSVAADHAIIEVGCTVPGARMLETLAAIETEIARLSDPRSIGAEELATAIAMERGTMTGELETRVGLATALGTAFARRSTLEQLAVLDAEVGRVAAEDVARVARRFRRDAAPIVMIGHRQWAAQLERTRPGRVMISDPPR